MLKITLILSTLAIYANTMPQEPHSTPDYGPPEPYEYNYKVEDPPTNTYYGKSENGDNTGKVTGSYYVWLPDGRLMTVEYVADKGGFVPKISYQHNANPINSPNPFTTSNPLGSKGSKGIVN